MVYQFTVRFHMCEYLVSIRMGWYSANADATVRVYAVCDPLRDRQTDHITASERPGVISGALVAARPRVKR